MVADFWDALVAFYVNAYSHGGPLFWFLAAGTIMLGASVIWYPFDLAHRIKQDLRDPVGAELRWQQTKRGWNPAPHATQAQRDRNWERRNDPDYTPPWWDGEKWREG